ncbi:MAG: hypothetical protein PHS92_04845 [Candidatus Gracilibacteria bacterium]|nr:hypothetical protein [Candidatus Gracilibacteria bacterium]
MDYNRDRNSSRSGGGGYGGGGRGGRDSGRRDGGRAEMFRTVCADCGNGCEVPFKPTGDRPVFCSDCFRREENGGGGRDFDRDDRGGRDRNDRGRRDSYDSGDRMMFEAVCDECGSNCELPFKPSSDKPVYCSDCFSKVDKSKSKRPDDSKIEFEKLNEKLDMIIRFLNITDVKTEKAKPVKAMKNEILEDIFLEAEDEIIESETPVKEKAVRKTTKKESI